MQDLVGNETKATAYVLDVLDINGPAVDDVSNWLLCWTIVRRPLTPRCTCASTKGFMLLQTFRDGPQSSLA